MIRNAGAKYSEKVPNTDEVYYYGQDNPSTKKYDQILCSAYWSLYKWQLPVNNDIDQKLIDSCNTYCAQHVERDEKDGIRRESSKGFCISDAWHGGDHIFQCQDKHESLEMYQGVDVCFVIDTTGSMAPYFEKVKNCITRIINDNQSLMKRLGKSTSNFHFAVVEYRDHPDQADYVVRTCDFTTDESAKQYVANLKSDSGGDFPEAVLDGLDAACTLNWRDKADHLLFHILDAPPHGKIYYTQKGDKWPDGCPCGKTSKDVLQRMKNKNIKYHVLACSSYLNMMITDFQNYIDVKELKFDTKITLEDIIVKRVHLQLADNELTLRKT